MVESLGESGDILVMAQYLVSDMVLQLIFDVIVPMMILVNNDPQDVDDGAFKNKSTGKFNRSKNQNVVSYVITVGGGGWVGEEGTVFLPH